MQKYIQKKRFSNLYLQNAVFAGCISRKQPNILIQFVGWDIQEKHLTIIIEMKTI